MSDVLFQEFSTVQSNEQLGPQTLASAATIVPVTKFTRVTGTVQITKITPPVTGYCEITLVFTSAYAALGTGGGANGIGVAYTSVADRPIDLCYDPRTALWYPKAVV